MTETISQSRLKTYSRSKTKKPIFNDSQAYSLDPFIICDIYFSAKEKKKQSPKLVIYQ